MKQPGKGADERSERGQHEDINPQDNLPSKEVLKSLGLARELAATDLTPVTNRPRGAVVMNRSGRITKGSSIEFPKRPRLGICAEHTALCAAVIEKLTPDVIVIWTQSGPGSPWPCGVCRQVLAELAPKATLWLQVDDQAPERTSVGELLPYAFDGGALPNPPERKEL